MWSLASVWTLVCVCGGRGKKMIVVLCEGGTIIVVCVCEEVDER